jgi:predicted deacylase
MKTTVKVGSCSAEPSAKSSGQIGAGNHPDGSAIELPVLIANGADDGPRVWINGSIHGDEPEGPLAIISLFRRLRPEKMRGAVIGIPVVNTVAFEACERGNPLDTFSYDMNRIYPGRPEGFLSERVAHAHYQEMVGQADVEISIHSGGAHSYLAQAAIFGPGEKSFELAKALGPGWDLLLRSFASKGTPSAVMDQLGRASVTIELGGICDTVPERYLRNGELLAESLMNVLKHYGVVEGEAQYADRWLVGSADVMSVQQSGLWVPEPKIVMRRPVKEGTLVAKVLNLRGEVLEEVRTPEDCVVFGIRTRPQVFAGDWAVFYSVVDQEIVV